MHTDENKINQKLIFYRCSSVFIRGRIVPLHNCDQRHNGAAPAIERPKEKQDASLVPDFLSDCADRRAVGFWRSRRHRCRDCQDPVLRVPRDLAGSVPRRPPLYLKMERGRNASGPFLPVLTFQSVSVVAAAPTASLLRLRGD